MVESPYQDVIEKAFQALKNAYAPYSNFQVGACFKMKDGQYIVGVNVENASYGLGICAERTALFTAVSLGYKQEDIVCLAIVSGAKRMIAPCGACRQVLCEWMPQYAPIILSDGNTIKETNISELLPMCFSQEDLT